MGTRSKKYFDRLKGQIKKKHDKKILNGKKAYPVISSTQNNTADQDDTGGGNASGKRSDNN